MPAILAHGALGPFDEIIFIGIAVIFLGMMGVSWLRSQDVTDDELEPGQPAPAPDAEHFELE